MYESKMLESGRPLLDKFAIGEICIEASLHNEMSTR